MTMLLARPWSLEAANGRTFGPTDCFLAELSAGTATELGRASHARLLTHDGHELRLFPYPRSGVSALPPRVRDLPVRPPTGQEPQNPEEEIATNALARMHDVLARVGDLKSALDDPEHLWDRLAKAWLRAEDKSQPRMAEIVRQAHDMPAQLGVLGNRIRRVLRRTRERVPIDRAQEIDKSSMIWFARQPGRTTVERAGFDQRVLAIARHENFDTLENRVVHSYVRLARLVCRQWVLENARSKTSNRYHAVETFARSCRRFDWDLSTIGVGLAESGITPNYVLMEDRDYRAVREAWLRLLRQEFLEDNLWAWQAQSWTDFCVLALALSLHKMEGAELVAQAPLVWRDNAIMGQRFLHDTPLAVFWLRRENVIVELQARPEAISRIQAACRAWVWLRISDLSANKTVRLAPVWTPHTFVRVDALAAAKEAVQFVVKVTETGPQESIRDSLILLSGHGSGDVAREVNGIRRVAAIALDASGPALREGMSALGSFLHTCVEGDERT